MPPGLRPTPSRIVPVLCAAWLVLGLFYLFLATHRETNWPLSRSDGEGYFAYLPLAFVYHTADLSVIAPFQEQGVPAGASFVAQTGHWAIKYPIGVALTAAPFFLAAHLFCHATHLYPADGYSLPYQLSLSLAALGAAFVALWALRRWLSRRFSPPAVAATLLFLVFGTNLAHYATFDAFASHIYSVAALALFLDALDSFAACPTALRATLLGLLAGYGFLTRNTTVIYFVPLFFLPLLGGRLPLRAWLRGAAIAAAAGFLAILPQLLLWKYSRGSFLAYSYGDEGFTNLRDPLFAKVFWSWRKGAFVHFPFLLLPVIGLAWAAWAGRPKPKPLERGAVSEEPAPAAPLRIEAALALLCGLLQSYIAASWSTWPFGGSLGHRAFVDFYPLLALGAGWLAERGLAGGHRRLVWGTTVAAVLYAQVFTQLYWFHLVKSDSMTRADFARLPTAALVQLPIYIGGSFYDAAFDLRHPRNTGSADWWKGTRAVLSLHGPAPAEVREGEPLRVALTVTNLGPLTLKHWGRRGNIRVRAILTDADGTALILRPKRFLPAPVDPGERLDFPLAFTLPPGLPSGAYTLELSLWHGQKDSLTALGLANALRLPVQLK